MATLEGSSNANVAKEEARNSSKELRSKGQTKAQLSIAMHVHDDIAAAIDMPNSASLMKKKIHSLCTSKYVPAVVGEEVSTIQLRDIRPHHQTCAFCHSFCIILLATCAVRMLLFGSSGGPAILPKPSEINI